MWGTEGWQQPGRAPRARHVRWWFLVAMWIGLIAIAGAGAYTINALGPPAPPPPPPPGAITFTTPSVRLSAPALLPRYPRASGTAETFVDSTAQDATLRTTSTGARVALNVAGDAWWTAPGYDEVFSSGRTVSGDVQFLRGAAGNALGLGCASSGSQAYWFFVHDDGTWAFDHLSPQPDSQVDPLVRKWTPALKPTTSVNELTVACLTESAGRSRFMLAVNGTPVANLTTAAPTGGWLPIIAQCSPDGPDLGLFTNIEAWVKPVQVP